MFGSLARVSVDEEKIQQVLTRGVAEVLPSVEGLKKILLSGRRLRIKLGIDPTSPNLHIGRSIPLLKLKDFEDLGHQVVFIIGDATGVVGDTSDKDAERPMLEEKDVAKNLTTYIAQVSRILTKSKLEVRRNSEWLLKLNYREIGEHASLFSVADFIARDNIKRRLETGKRVSLREVLYPLMQGYDSVAVRADVELGGTDQKFNLLAGRTMQEKSGQPPQHVLMTDLIPGTDGRKMSSSWGNTINLLDSPKDMFGKTMTVPDELVKTYLTHATRMPLPEIEKHIAGHPKDAKMALAHEFVRMYHGQVSADSARGDFITAFSKGGVPADVSEVRFEGSLMNTLVTNGVVESNSEYRRLQEAGAIKDAVSGAPVSTDESLHGKTIRVGKHRFVKIK